MTQINGILVKRYLRRHPRTSKQVVQNALRTLRRLGADKHLEHACYAQISDEDSQVKPVGGFRRGACTVINVEHGDTHDEVEAATTLFHESLHARDIAKNGAKGVSQGNEIKAHKETISFLRDWARRERRENVKRRIKEEIDEENESIHFLENEVND